MLESLFFRSTCGMLEGLREADPARAGGLEGPALVPTASEVPGVPLGAVALPVWEVSACRMFVSIRVSDGLLPRPGWGGLHDQPATDPLGVPDLGRGA